MTADVSFATKWHSVPDLDERKHCEWRPSLSFAINNPKASTLTGVDLADALPPGLIVLSPNRLTAGRTITAIAE